MNWIKIRLILFFLNRIMLCCDYPLPCQIYAWKHKSNNKWPPDISQTIDSINWQEPYDYSFLYQKKNVTYQVYNVLRHFVINIMKIVLLVQGFPALNEIKLLLIANSVISPSGTTNELIKYCFCVCPGF